MSKPIDLSTYSSSASPSPSLASEDSYYPPTSPRTPIKVKREEPHKQTMKALFPPSPSPSPHKDKTRKSHQDSDPNADEDDDIKPKIENEKKKRGRPAGKGNSSQGGKARSGGGGGGSRKMGSWTKREVRQLWDAMGFLPVKVKWDDVAEKVDGRDKLSCSNKWRYDMLPKIEAFIDSLGE